jgi:hypothetical protein
MKSIHLLYEFFVQRNCADLGVLLRSVAKSLKKQQKRFESCVRKIITEFARWNRQLLENLIPAHHKNKKPQPFLTGVLFSHPYLTSLPAVFMAGYF